MFQIGALVKYQGKVCLVSGYTVDDFYKLIWDDGHADVNYTEIEFISRSCDVSKEVFEQVMMDKFCWQFLLEQGDILTMDSSLKAARAWFECLPDGCNSCHLVQRCPVCMINE